MEIHYNHYMSNLSKYIFLKAHDPQKSLTLRDDKDNDKYTHTQIHKLEVLERPIMCYIF